MPVRDMYEALAIQKIRQKYKKTDSPTFKMSIREYKDIRVKVGDKVTVEITN
jgi:ribosomal protein S17